MSSKFLELLQEPEVRSCPVDGEERFTAHGKILARKKMIREVFVDMHRMMYRLDCELLDGAGQRIELGAGVFSISRTIRGVISTDIVPAAHLDRTLDACKMDLDDASVRCFYLQNVFHHFPDPQKFFDEINRTLVPGGGAVIVEPHSGPFAAWLYPRLFATEGYDKTASDWKTEGSGPMSGANQALSYIVFERDMQKFSDLNPGLEIVRRDTLTSWPRYLVSGGLNFRQLVPDLLHPLVVLGERMLSPIRGTLGLHRVIVIRKRDQSPR